eukprot:CAMPEP_0179028152 /NCGR_PEP_ID=MMETSP0796-20121207/9401_1 /TAXON_ID=73915 /ORGANISM="Pyrodinium bahamense, Strain pbaha01" /LENGTH=108 /DNA_ID=CAMNT_0020724291 /DNA_START=806 /DNA_END=1132 /DNA_ORIENTATION=-
MAVEGTKRPTNARLRPVLPDQGNVRCKVRLENRITSPRCTSWILQTLGNPGHSPGGPTSQTSSPPPVSLEALSNANQKLTPGVLVGVRQKELSASVCRGSPHESDATA